MSNWVNVKNCLPEQYESVLCAIEDGYGDMQCEVLFINPDEEWFGQDGREILKKVLYWTLLPDIPAHLEIDKVTRSRNKGIFSVKKTIRAGDPIIYDFITECPICAGGIIMRCYIKEAHEIILQTKEDTDSEKLDCL